MLFGSGIKATGDIKDVAETDYVPEPMIAIVDAPKAAVTAEKVTTRTEDTTNTLILG